MSRLPLPAIATGIRVGGLSCPTPSCQASSMIQLIATALTIAASTFGPTHCEVGKSPRLYEQPLPKE